MTGATFKCPSCAKVYVNRADIAGGKITCECGHLINVPEFAGASPESYEFVEEWNPDPQAKKKPTVKKPAPPPPEEIPDYSPPKKETMEDRYGPRKEVTYRAQGEAAYELERELHKRAGRMWMGLAVLGAIVLGTVVWGVKHHHSAPPATPLRADDQEVVDAINDNGATEAAEWINAGKRHSAMGWSNGQALGHIKTWYSLGAVKVLAFGEGITDSFVIELPADAGKREALFAWQNDYARETRQKPAADQGQKYLIIELKL